MFPKVTVLALTATATPNVAADIRRQLDFRQGNRTYQMSFSRHNISYIVRQSTVKISDIGNILQRTEGSAIVYVRNRKRTREVADYLVSLGISATFYHAGLDHEIKTLRQNDWKEGKTRVIVATNAFGMGIDKPDVRIVIHYDLPPSLEEYYQEAGRAGRDGLPSYAVLLYSPHDKAILRRHLTGEFPDRKDILRVYERVCTFLDIAIGEGYDRIYEFDLDKFLATFRMQQEQVLASLRLLGRSGYLEYIDERENSTRVRINLSREELYHLNGITENAERVLSKIMRLYPGLFMDYVFINEKRVARELDLGERDVYEALLELSRAKICSFVPRSRTPYIYVPTSREELRYVVIGRAVYEDRMKVMEQRTEAMIDYASNSGSCRVERMLAYFGEPRPAPCRRCDVCRTRKSRAPLSDRELTSRVVAYLEARPRGARYEAVIASVGNVDSHRAASLLARMLQEGFATMEGPYITLHPLNQ